MLKYDFYLQLQKEREKIHEYKRQVQNLVNKSKKIVQLKPRNPDYRSSKPIILRALCDYKQDQVGAHLHRAIPKLSLPLHIDFVKRAESNLGSYERHGKDLSFLCKAASAERAAACPKSCDSCQW